MNHKRLRCLLALLWLSLFAAAQTQQGYVKTNGRIENGKYIQGKTIDSVMITVKGSNPILSKNGGRFSFIKQGKDFSLKQVHRKNYVLIDPEILNRQYDYSSNPFVIYMSDKKELDAYRRSIENSVRNKLYGNLRQREAEVDSLMAQNRITEEKYHELLQKIYSDYDDNEKIVKGMADWYVKMDFDSISEFRRRVSEYILAGHLLEADSLIRSQGSFAKRETELNQLSAANAAVRQTLERSVAMENKKRESLAQDYYDLFTIFKMQHQFDSAALYIQRRAHLDTTNAQWQADAGSFFSHCTAEYDKALEYFTRALDILEKVQGKEHPDVALLRNNIGTVYYHLGSYANALKYHTMALGIREKVLGKEHPDVASSYSHIGAVYSAQGDNAKALEYYNKALAIWDVEHPDVAMTYSDIGAIYLHQGNYSTGLEYIQKALALMDSTEENELRLSIIFNNLGNCYDKLGNDDSAIYYYNKSLEIRKKHISDSHPSIALSYHNMGTAYHDKGEYKKALECYINALMAHQKGYGENNVLSANVYNAMGNLFSDVGNYKKAIDFFEESIRIMKLLPNSDQSTLGTIYNNVALLHKRIGNYQQSLDYYQKVQDIFIPLFGAENIRMATIYDNTGEVYSLLGNNTKSLQYRHLALDIRIKILGLSHQDVGLSYLNIGAVYNELAQTDSTYADSALYYFQKALDVYQKAENVNPSHVASLYNNMGAAYHIQLNYEKAEECFLRSLDIKKSIFGEGNINLASSYDNMGLVHKKMGKLDEALKWHQRALDIYNAAESVDSLAVAITFNNIGVIFRDKGDFAQAFDYLNRAYDIYRRRLGEDNAGVKIIYKNIEKTIKLQEKEQEGSKE